MSCSKGGLKAAAAQLRDGDGDGERYVSASQISCLGVLLSITLHLNFPAAETKAMTRCGCSLYVCQYGVFLLELLSHFFLSSVTISSYLEEHHSNWTSYL